VSRRSVMNDRYRVERSGKTRKSASAAKPKRVAGEAASAPAKKAAKPKSALGRAVGKGQSKAAKPPSRIEQTPRMKSLRRIWWVLMAAALALAGVMWYMSANKLGNALTYRVVLVSYVTAIAGALYLEFGPLRHARLEAASTSKGGKKVAPGEKAKAGDVRAPVAGDEGGTPIAVTPSGRKSVMDVIGGFFRRGGDGGGEGDGPS